MKKILSLIFAMVVVLTVNAQTFKAPSAKVYTDTITTFTYQMPDKVYKVYKSKSGAFYIWKVSKKTGKPYKMYLPKEIQIQMGRRYN